VCICTVPVEWMRRDHSCAVASAVEAVDGVGCSDNSSSSPHR
jgi:Uri superfamily endonuclease